MSGVVERRKSKRLEVLESFQIFLMIPELGDRKIYLTDISETGIGFEVDLIESLENKELSHCYMYLNPSLHLPIKFKVAHIQKLESKVIRVGCELKDKKSQAYKTYQKFIRLFDDLSDFLK